MSFHQQGEIEDILAEEFLNQSQIEGVWTQVVGSLKSPCDLQNFLELNEVLEEIAAYD